MDFKSHLPYHHWTPLNPSGGHPPSPRYKHAAALVDNKLYVIGGSRNGRYLSDIHVFDFGTLTWSTLIPSTDLEKAFPATAGHSLVKWGNELLLVAGHSKEASDTMAVWSIDLETHNFSAVRTHGKVPAAREGQSIALMGSKLFIFGGEDARRQLLNDLHILDLNTMTWDLVETKKTPPSPRFDHTAVVHDQYLLIFGGSSHSTCFNDLHVLDLQTMEWSQPETQGATVTPRGGHASAIVDDNWYIVGGGDNRSGATETIVLNMSKLVWSVVTSVKGREPLASEGIALCSATIDGEKLLVAFGGYNGKYNNELFVLRPKPIESIQPRLFQSPAAAAAAASVTAAYAWTTAADKKQNELVNVEDGNLNGTQPKSSPKVILIDADKLTSEKRILESKLAEIKDESTMLKGRLDELNDSHTLLLMELQSVQGQLAAERSRCIKLEIQIAETQKRLESVNSIEHELELLRHQKSQIEQDMATAQRQKSGSVWQWVAGSTQNPEE